VPLILSFHEPTDTVRDTTKELRSMATQYATSSEATQLLMAPSNGREASSDIALWDTGEGTKGRRKRRKQRPQEDTTATNDNGGNDKQLGGSSMVRIATTAGSSKCQVWPPTDHFEKLLEEACPNHAYPVKHKLRDCGMMKNVMALGSITRGMQFDEVPNVGDATPLPSEDSVMMIYDGCPSPRMRRVSNPSPGTPICCG
jgi:hypothetical protein